MGNDKDRTTNPGAVLDPNRNEPWTSNYPPLAEWLREIDARCDFQIFHGKGRHRWAVEQWRAPGSMPFILVIYPDKHGWELYTPGSSNSIAATLDDAKARIFKKEG